MFERENTVKYAYTMVKKRGLEVVSVSVMAVVLSACSTLPTSPSSNSTTSIGNASQPPVNFVTDFPDLTANEIALNSELDVFKIGDIAEIQVYNVENLSGTFTVDRDGNIVFPLINTVSVAGKTTLDLQAELTERYGSRYLQNPSISVKLEARELGKVVVDGAVNKPGVFEVFKIITLSEAVALAEGMNDDANKKEVFIVRNVDGQQSVKSVNMKAIRTAQIKDPLVAPGDVIFVQDSQGRVLFREFLRTAPFFSTAAILLTRTGN